MRYVIGLDIGTSGTKTVLFDEKGKTVVSKTVEYPLYQPENGWAEQDPLDWWNAASEGLRAVTAGVDSSEIAGIGLSGQMHGLVMLDKNGSVLRRAIIWCDQRTGEECREIEEKVGRKRLIEITANPALTGFTASKILWVRKHEPQIYEKCAHILLPKDYIRYMLTGEFATEVSDASGMQLLDIPNRRWSAEVAEKLEIDISLLGKVYESPEVTGRVTEAAARLTGVPKGTVVAGGAGDNAAAAVGTAAVRNGRAFTTIGTSGVVYLHSDKVSIDPLGRVHTFCCAVPGEWHMMGVTQGAGLSLKWFRDTFCGEEKQSAGEKIYKLMDEMAEESPIGSNRLLYLPYLMGERTPHLDPNARGVFFGMSAMHTKNDFIRAVLEGVGFSLNDCLSVFGELGISAESMLACGGGAKSRLWRGILADIYNCPISLPNSDEGPALGSAVLAMTAAGIYSDVREAAEAVAGVKESVSPDAERHAEYEKYYNVYKGLYASLKNDFAKLAEI